MQRLLQGIEDQLGLHRTRHPPADDPAREGVDDERDIDEPCPSGDVGEFREPELVRRRGEELRFTWSSGQGAAGSGTSHHARQPHLGHQARDGTAGDGYPFPVQLPPDLSHAVDPEVLVPDALDLGPQGRVPFGSVRALLRIGRMRRYVDGAIGSTRQIGSTP